MLTDARFCRNECRSNECRVEVRRRTRILRAGLHTHSVHRCIGKGREIRPCTQAGMSTNHRILRHRSASRSQPKRSSGPFDLLIRWPPRWPFHSSYCTLLPSYLANYVCGVETSKRSMIPQPPRFTCHTCSKRSCREIRGCATCLSPVVAASEHGLITTFRPCLPTTPIHVCQSNIITTSTCSPSSTVLSPSCTRLYIRSRRKSLAVDRPPNNPAVVTNRGIDFCLPNAVQRSRETHGTTLTTVRTSLARSN